MTSWNWANWYQRIDESVFSMLRGSCHCGAIQIELARKPPRLTECNCSICRRYGAQWAYSTQRFATVHSAANAIITYKDGYRTFHYHFCRRCGCLTHYTRVKTTNDNRIAINARMLHPDDIAAIRIRKLGVIKNKQRK